MAKVEPKIMVVYEVRPQALLEYAGYQPMSNGSYIYKFMKGKNRFRFHAYIFDDEIRLHTDELKGYHVASLEGTTKEKQRLKVLMQEMNLKAINLELPEPSRWYKIKQWIHSLVN